MNSPSAIPASASPAFRLDARAILDQLPVAVMLTDRSGQVLFRNQQAAQVLANGNHLKTVFRGCAFGPGDDWRDHLAKVLSSRRSARWTGMTASQPRTILHIGCAPFEDGSNSPAEAIFYIQTDHESCDAEEADEVSGRLASLGKLAARVAHELNNPLDGILRYINLALRLAADVPESRLTSYLSESRSGLLRMIRIITDLLEFSRNSDAGFETASVNEIVEQAIRSCSSAADAGRVVVTANFQNDQMPQLRGGRLYQVFCNLIRNAIDAMPSGGRLSITTGLVDESVVIRVTDTGIGLPEPVEKVFEPFYTTKPPGKGTGLGLAICKEFVEGLGGTIAAGNLEGGGAAFTVRIPVAGLQPPKVITSPEPRP